MFYYCTINHSTLEYQPKGSVGDAHHLAKIKHAKWHNCSRCAVVVSFSLHLDAYYTHKKWKYEGHVYFNTIQSSFLGTKGMKVALHRNGHGILRFKCRKKCLKNVLLCFLLGLYNGSSLLVCCHYLFYNHATQGLKTDITLVFLLCCPNFLK